LHSFAEILAAMAGDPDDALSGEAPLEVGEPGSKRRFLLDAGNDPMQRIDHRVAGDVYGCRVDILAPQGLGSRLGRRAMQCGEGADDLAIDLFGPRVVDVSAA